MNLGLPRALRRRGVLRGRAYVVLTCIFFASLSQLLLVLEVSPTIVRGDGVGYYAYLRSLVFDHDVDFSNEYSYFASILPENSQPLTTSFLYGPKTAAGYPHNPWPVGPAILWSPFFLVGHLTAKLAGGLGLPVALDGYSLPYQLGIAIGSAVYAFVGLMLMYRLCHDHFGFHLLSLHYSGVVWHISYCLYVFHACDVSCYIFLLCRSVHNRVVSNEKQKICVGVGRAWHTWRAVDPSTIPGWHIHVGRCCRDMLTTDR